MIGVTPETISPLPVEESESTDAINVAVASKQVPILVEALNNGAKIALRNVEPSIGSYRLPPEYRSAPCPAPSPLFGGSGPCRTVVPMFYSDLELNE